MVTKKEMFEAVRSGDSNVFLDGLKNMKWKGGLDAREDVTGRGDGPSIFELVTSEEHFKNGSIVYYTFNHLLKLGDVERAKKIIELDAEICKNGSLSENDLEYRFLQRLYGAEGNVNCPELLPDILDVCEKYLPETVFFSFAARFSPDRAARYLEENIEGMDDETKNEMLSAAFDSGASDFVEILAAAAGADIAREIENRHEKRRRNSQPYAALLRGAAKAGRLGELFPAEERERLQETLIFLSEHEPRLVKAVLALGANPNAVADSYPGGLTTALFCAAPESVSVLIEAGADVNFTSLNQRADMDGTPIMNASKEFIHLFLAAGADVEKDVGKYGFQTVFEKLLEKNIPVPYILSAKNEDFIDNFSKEDGGDEKKQLLAETLNEYRERFMRMRASCEDHIPSLAKEIRDIGLGDGQYYFVDKLFCGLVLGEGKNDYTNKLAEFMALTAKDGRLDTEDIFYRRAAYHIIGSIRDKTMREEYLGKVVEMAESMVRGEIKEKNEKEVSVEEAAKIILEKCLRDVTANGAFPVTPETIRCALESAKGKMGEMLADAAKTLGNTPDTPANIVLDDDYEPPPL